MKPKIYKFNVVEGLKDLASYEFQKIAWFENDQNLVSSFSDDVSMIYEDSGMEGYLDKKTIFGKEADDALRLLDDMVMAIFETDYDERELIDSPRMEAIRRQASIALALVKASDGKDSTVDIIEEPDRIY